jgi:hypothetical protein
MIYSARPALRPFRDYIQDVGGINATDVEMDVIDGETWSIGDIVCFDDGDEARVTAIATNTLTIVRDANGTTGSTHSQYDEVEKNARFTVQSIDDAIETVLSDLWPNVYVLSQGTLGTATAGTEWYTVTDTDIREVLSVFYQNDSYLNPVPMFGWEYRTHLPSAEFTQEQGIFVPSFCGADIGDSMYYIARVELTVATELLDRQEPLVALGAVHNLLGFQGVVRTHDPGQRTDRTVQPGQTTRDSIWFLREYRNARTREEIRLHKEEELIPKHRLQQRKRRFVA